MEKLIKLLNEYEAERYKTSVIADIREQKEDNLSYLSMNWNYSELLCISKGYEFIKRLVENDKIDESKIEIHWFSFYESVLMELAIKDDPIEFLISALK